MPKRQFSDKGSLDSTKDGEMDFTYLLMMDYIYHVLFVLYSLKRMQSKINTEDLFERLWRVLEHLHFKERLFQNWTLQNVPSACLWVTLTLSTSLMESADRKYSLLGVVCVDGVEEFM